METKTVFAVRTNTDLTEGRGYEYYEFFCEIEATAKRLAKKNYIMGTDSPVSEVKAYFINSSWYLPSNIIKPSVYDIEKQAEIDKMNELKNAKNNIFKKMREAGFSDDEISILTKS